jgi:GGDEF domain-containing protein
MSAETVEARMHLERLVRAFEGGTPLKTIIPALARRVGISARRCAAIWHREARGIYAHEMDALRSAVVQRLAAEVARLDAEIAIARLSPTRPDQDALRAADAALLAAKAALNQGNRNETA